MALQAIKYERGRLQLLDQRLLPHKFEYLDVPDPQTSWQHIKDMVVRGAPAIGVTGVLTMAVDLVSNKGTGAAFASAQECLEYVLTTLDYLVTSRPTAVNLADGAERLRAAAQAAAAEAGATAASIVEAVISAAEAYFAEDLKANKALGAHGAKALLEEASKRSRGLRPGGKLRVLTHCNTGSLATAGYGTALGIIRALHEAGKLEHAYCTETRPYNQGARLTAFELVHDGLPATLVCDSATAHLMSLGQVDAVVVGADRVVANGDTANKIGTYMLSLVAAAHDVPFFIAAPTTTLDPALPDGSHIEIEQRPAEELTHFRGTQVVTENIQVWNPSFDVAPGRLIAGIITELGPVPKAGDTFQVPDFMTQAGLWPRNAEQSSSVAAAAAAAANSHATANGHASAPAPAAPGGFEALSESTVGRYIEARPDLLKRVGPAGPEGYKVKEVGDGNINFVYIVEGPAGAIVIKQSLPFVRCVGESWPLTQERLRIESAALIEEAKFAQEHVPEVYLYDPAMAVIAMQYIAPPAIILRRGLIQGEIYPHLAEHMSHFLAHTLFETSLLALGSAEHKKRVAEFMNPEMCKLTEQVIFMEPYMDAPNNRHTSPQLDKDVQDLRADVQAKVAISALKRKFMTNAEALLHGDLHTGSVMVTDKTTMVIDPEFAYYGPMAFDVAKILANLLLALFGSHGQEKVSGSCRRAQRDWLARCTADIWNGFRSKFEGLWNARAASGSSGDSHPQALFGPVTPQGPSPLSACQSAFFDTLWQDTVAFAGAFMVRRIVGIAHVADLDSIPDADIRAACERRALTFGRQLLVKGGAAFSGADTLVQAAVAAAAAQ